VSVQIRSLLAFAKYSARQVFAGNFVLLAVAVFATVVVMYTVEAAVPPSPGTIYYFLLVPGGVLVFYPAVYGIQSDVDARMLETLFGIPDYRFKVWVVRLAVQQGVIALLLAVLAWLCRVAMADFSVGAMVLQLMFPLTFLAALGFVLATLLRNGNAAAGVLVVLLFFAWVLSEPLSGSRWNLFHNPFAQVGEVEELVGAETTFNNRAYLVAGSGLCVLMGLLRLRQRERFV